MRKLPFQPARLHDRSTRGRRHPPPARPHSVRDYIAVDNRGRTIAGPSNDYGAMKREAERAGGFVKFHTDRPPAAHEAKRHRRGKRMSQEAVVELAGRVAEEVGGNRPKPVPGGYRWSEKNESAYFVTYTPQHDVKVVCVVSIFEDGSTAVSFFSDEDLSGTSTFENITHFTYPDDDVSEMVKDINWARKTIDGYAESWQQPEADVDEARRKSAHNPIHRPRAGRATRRRR